MLALTAGDFDGMIPLSSVKYNIWSTAAKFSM